MNTNVQVPPYGFQSEGDVMEQDDRQFVYGRPRPYYPYGSVSLGVPIGYGGFAGISFPTPYPYYGYPYNYGGYYGYPYSWGGMPYWGYGGYNR